jgi:hypothetical protein
MFLVIHGMLFVVENIPAQVVKITLWSKESSRERLKQASQARVQIPSLRTYGVI